MGTRCTLVADEDADADADEDAVVDGTAVAVVDIRNARIACALSNGF